MSYRERVPWCSQAQFDALHEALDKVRSTSTTVKVDKAALSALLMDHANLLKGAE
jgi:hypothetical protein